MASGPALAFYKSGNYQAAIKAGLAENNENGFALAARATLAEETLGDKPCMECLKRAEGYARRAIAAGGRMPESYVYLAAALGHQSRIIGTIRAGMSDYGEQSRDALNTALKINPNFSWALAAMGGWNIEVVLQLPEGRTIKATELGGTDSSVSAYCLLRAALKKRLADAFTSKTIT